MPDRGWRRTARTALFATVFAALYLIAPGRLAQADPPVPDPFFGTWQDGLSPTPAAAGAELDGAAAAGIGLIRQYIWWDRIETSPGVFDWSRTDQLVADATARGIRILPTLLYTPSFYSSKPEGSTSTAQFPPSDPQTMARFAEAMVDRYGTGGSYWCTPLPDPLPPICPDEYVPITAWEVWNEPDFPSWWKGRPNASEYLPLLRAVSEGIRRADSAAEVVLGSLTGNGASKPGGYLDQLYALGAADAFDTVAVNPYAKNVAGMITFLRKARAITESHGDGQVPLRVTEYGWATGGFSPNLVTDEICQASLLHAGTEELSSLRAELNIKSIIQFQWHDVPTSTQSWPHYAGVKRADGTAKPALATLTDAIAGRPAPGGFTLEEACPEDRRGVDPTNSDTAASDAFGRTVSDGWGSADSGGPYTHGTGTASLSVSEGVGRMQVSAGESRSAVLEYMHVRDVDLRASISTDEPATGTGGHVVTLSTRRTAQDTEYRVRARFAPDGAVHLSAVKATGAVETPLGEEVPLADPHVPGLPIVLRARVTGANPTTISVKAWRVGEAEPSGWSLARTDSEAALQTAGDVGLRAEVSGSATSSPVTFAFDDLKAQLAAPK